MLDTPFAATPEFTCLRSWEDVPTIGSLAINAYVLKSKEPVVVDAGTWIGQDEYMTHLRNVIDPKDVRWIVLTHGDNDHKGALHQLLKEAPKAKLVTNLIGAARMMDTFAVPLDRCRILNIGESLDIGDRTITAVRPAVWDDPPTTGYYESKNGAYFCSDSMGGFIPRKTENANEYSMDELAQAMCFFASVLSPWVHLADAGKFRKHLQKIQALQAKTVLSCHMPKLSGNLAPLFEAMSKLPDSKPVELPGQEFVDNLLKQMAQGGPPQGH